MRASRCFLPAAISLCVVASSPAADSRDSAVNSGRAQFLVNIRSDNIVGPAKVGRGICLDTPCVNVLTNYHVAAFIGRAKVEGVRIKHSVYATGPLDPAAAPIPVVGSVQRFDPQRDLALLTLERPLPLQYGAATFATYSPQANQRVRRLPAVPSIRNEGQLRAAGKVRLLTPDDKTRVLESALLADFNSPQGTSGGALCDEQGAVLGIISQQDGSLALPVSVISEFLQQANPILASRLNISNRRTLAAQTELAEIPIPDIPLVEDNARFTKEESEAAVTAVRKRAEQQLRALDHVLAEASFITLGCNSRWNVRKYQVVLLGSNSTFREVAAIGSVGEPSTISWEHRRPCSFEPGATWEEGIRGIARGLISYEGQFEVLGETRHRFRVQQIECVLWEWRDHDAEPIRTQAQNCAGELETNDDFSPTNMQWIARFTASENKWTSSLSQEMTFQTFELRKGFDRVSLPVRVELNTKPRSWIWSSRRASLLLGNFRPFGAEHHIDGAFGSDHRIVGVDDEGATTTAYSRH